MEWVENTGRTVQEAKDRALDQLGVADDDAEFEVLDEPRAGLFGRMRGEARVRARVRPTQPRPKVERRERKKRGESGAADAGVSGHETSGEASAAASSAASYSGKVPSGKSRTPRQQTKQPAGAARSTASAEPALAAQGSKAPRVRRPVSDQSNRVDAAEQNKESDVDPQQVGEEAQRFVQGLVDAFGMQGVASLRRDDDDLEISLDGADLGLLVGPRGTTLQAIQELTRVAAQHRLGDHETRLRVDVAGYRERRRDALSRFAAQVAGEVLAEGQPRALEPMSSADRKVIHDALAGVGGVVTRSEGDDPQRRVVIAPAHE